MIKSMTGYGRGEVSTANRKIIVEIKTLNSKQFDLSTRIPSLYREKELEIRTITAKAISRGKTDLFVTYENVKPADKAASIDPVMFESYLGQISHVARLNQLNLTNEALIGTIIKLPDVLKTETVMADQTEFKALLEALTMAIENINEFRQHEGAALMVDLLKRVEAIEQMVVLINPYECERLETVKSRIIENISKLNIPIDSNRLEQELIFYIERLDITEEKVRLKQHCSYFKTVANENDEVGRKLGFIAQEMGREINTLGSKANHAGIQKFVVEMKDELEKIKEQLLNIL